jgi:SAM-dependent methyltransferase
MGRYPSAAVASAFDDAIWQMVPEEGVDPDPGLAAFVRSLPEVDSALDLGCGDGRLSCLVAARSLTVADVSRVALERAARRLTGARVVELEPDERLPLPDNAFDLVLCTETIEHVRDLQLLLSEARRVLVPGGRLAVTTPAHGRATGLVVLAMGMERRFDPFSPHLRHFTRRSLRETLGGMGFTVERLQSRRGTLRAVALR